MKYSAQIIIFFLQQYFINLVKRVTTMDHNRQLQFLSPANLYFEDFYLLVKRGFIPIQIDPDFAYGVYLMLRDCGFYQT